MFQHVPECPRQDRGAGIGFRTPLRQDHSWPEGRRETMSPSLDGGEEGVPGKTEMGGGYGRQQG